MKRILFVFVLVLLPCVARAQVPATVHAVWVPNSVADNVVQYQVTVDSSTPVTMLATACTPTVCSQTLTIPTFGLHTVSIVAQNLLLSTDPTSLQSSTPFIVSFTLGSKPTVVAGLKITN